MRCAFIENVTICEPVYDLDAAFVMQAKQNDSKRKPQNEETIVSKAALNLPHFDGTTISVML